MEAIIKRFFLTCCLITMAVITTGCGDSKSIVTGIDEREANIIVVFLESRGISATKQAVAVSSGSVGDSSSPKFNIIVDEDKSIAAMALLNRNGLPHRKGTDLLELFAQAGMMSTDKEQTIRYQAGLASQLNNMIMMIDGVIEASVQLSFPPTDDSALSEKGNQKPSAAVFVKHQGIIDDPNSHLEMKIKRLVAGSIQDLDINDVTVVSDRSRFTDVTLDNTEEMLSGPTGEYVKIWSIVMSQESAARFRTIFFFLLFIAISLLIIAGWMIWKMYPTLRSAGGLNELFRPLPIFWKKAQKDGTHPTNNTNKPDEMGQ